MANDDQERDSKNTATNRADLRNWAPEGEPVLELLRPETRLIPIAAGVMILGRESGSRRVALDYPGVSREHAQITRALGPSTSILDLRSKNGTAVNGELIHVRNLREGDRITLGAEVEMRFAYAVLASKEGPTLTPRELEVTSLVAAGLTNKEIGERLGVTRHAIDAVLRSAFRRVGVKTRAALAAWFERSM